MAKILITSLGTGVRKDGGYKEAKYQVEDNVYKESLIFKALHSHYHFDKIFMVGTKRSIWDAVYETFGKEKPFFDENIQLKLYEKQDGEGVSEEDLKVLKEMVSSDVEFEFYLIEFGLNETELWNNFGYFLEIGKKIEDDDEIYLDITHSFRSLSLMSFVMLNFEESMRQTLFKVKAVFYGMFEYIHESSNQEKIVPVVNLNILFELNEWIKAISVFKLFGRADLLKRLSDEKLGSSAQITKDLKHFSDNIGMSNLAAIKSLVDRINKRMDTLKNVNYKVLQLIYPDFESFVRRMKKEKLSDFQLEMAKWYFENKNYAFSYVSLAECAVTKVCELEEWSVSDEETRKDAKEMLKSSRLRSEKYFHYFEKWSTVNKIRNSIAHQLKESDSRVKTDIDNLKIYIQKFEKGFKTVKKL